MQFGDPQGLIWYDGEFCLWNDAQIHVLTHGLHYASSVFEGVRAYNGNVFCLDEHTERLFDSADILGMRMPYSPKEINKATLAVIEKNNLTNCYIRPVVWRGAKQMGLSAGDNPIHVAIAAWEWPSYFTMEQRMKGLRLKTAPYKRPSPETAPVHSKAAGLYMICTLAKAAAEDAGFDDAFFLDYRGYIAEATGANIFLVMNDGAIHTPIADCFLNGITRQTVMRLINEAGYKLVERHIMPDELANVKEVFITGTAIEVTPVSQIDDYHFTPSDICRHMMDMYNNLVQGA